MARQRSPRVPMEEQVRLINECRRSGMTDADWCKSQGIAVSTFYNWVKRCRKREAAKIQAPSYGHSDTPATKQDVVSVNIVPDVPEVLMAKQNHSPMSMNLDNSDKFMQICVLEVKIQDFSIGIHNDVDPMLLAQTLRILKELSC